MRTKCLRCGDPLTDKNAQDVGICLTCFAIENSDFSDEEARMRFISGADWYRDTVAKELEKLQAFKQYVHDRLDKMGIPPDPEPENNAAHGCRIEGRLNVVEKMMGNNVA